MSERARRLWGLLTRSPATHGQAIRPGSQIAVSSVHGETKTTGKKRRVNSSALDVVAGWGGAGGGVLSGVGLVVAGRAVEAEHGPAKNQQARGGPAHVERGPHLPLQARSHQRVVEVADDVVSRPGYGHHHQQTGQQEHHAGHNHDLGFGALIIHAVGALAAHHRQQHAEHGQDDTDDDEGAGRLQVLRQRQQRVVHLALHLARALHHAVHPQALPDGLRRDDVAADEGRHAPHGQRAAQDGAQPAQHGQRDAHYLQPHGSHGSASARRRGASGTWRGAEDPALEAVGVQEPRTATAHQGLSPGGSPRAKPVGAASGVSPGRVRGTNPASVTRPASSLPDCSRRLAGSRLERLYGAPREGRGPREGFQSLEPPPDQFL